jgi:hypothetical protein
MGCVLSLYITPEATAPDGSLFWSVVTKTNGHPAVTGFQTFRKNGDAPGTLVADHSGSATGSMVAIPCAALNGTGASLALGLPAALLKPDQTNVNNTNNGGNAAQNQGNLGINAQGQGQGQAQGQLQGQLQGQAQGQAQGQNQGQGQSTGALSPVTVLP